MRLPYRKPGKYSEPKSDFHISKQKYDELCATLASLLRRRPAAALEVSRLAELGDFSENVEYQLAKRKLRGINTKILYIENDINRAVIIKPRHNYLVEVGHTVTIIRDEKTFIYTILGSSESDPSKGVISQNSPIGAALLGRRINDEVVVSLPRGDVIMFIKEIN